MSQSAKVLKEVGAITAFGSTIEKLSGSGALGALSLSSEVSLVTTTGASTGTLGDGTPGQTKTVILVTDGGDYVLTPGTFANGTTVTLDDANDYIKLIYVDSTIGWVSLGGSGTVA